MSFSGKIAIITGSTRGIGKAVAVAYGRAGASVIITGKTTAQHRVLPGTIYDAADEVIKAGGNAIALEMDIRNEEMVNAAVKKGVQHFISKGQGSQLDILINNASAIKLTDTARTSMKSFDLMHQVNVRGTFCTTQACLPYFKGSQNPHILTYSPPLNMEPKWFKDFCAYTMSKYGMSMCALGMSEEFKSQGIAVNTMWPKTVIATSALGVISSDGSSETMMNKSRTPEIMADATLIVTSKPSKTFTGKFLIDEDVLREEGVTNFDKYAHKPGTTKFLNDLFLTPTEHDELKKETQQAQDPSKNNLLSTLEVIFEKLTDAASSGDFSAMQRIIQFKIKRADKGESFYWVADFPNKKMARFNEAQMADVTVILSLQNMVNMMTGKLDPMMGFLSGEIKIKGKLSDANKLGSLLTAFCNKYKI